MSIPSSPGPVKNGAQGGGASRRLVLATGSGCEDTVNALLARGWQPVPGLFSATTFGGGLVVALVLERPDVGGKDGAP